MNTHNLMRTYSVVFLVLFALILGACRGITPPATEPTLDLSLLYTQVAGTLAAEDQGGGGEGEAATATNTEVAGTPTFTSTPSQTPTNTPIPATNTPVVLCYQADFISDVTIPDGTVLGKEKNFTKTWRLKNSGTCVWEDNFDVVYVKGTNLADKKVYDMPKSVAPGDTVDISIPMTSPNKNGDYTSYWMIRTNNDHTFGVGSGAAVAFYAQITVGKGGSSGNSGYDFAAKYCDADWESDDGDLPCPGSIGSNKGFVRVLDDPKLETGTEHDPAIWMRPNQDTDGFIRGVFPKYTVVDGDHFIAVIGCHGDSNDCRVQFTLSYINENDVEKQLGTWDEKYDDLTRTVDVDLSSLAGKKIKIVLTIEPNNSRVDEADGLWYLPRIENK